MTETLKLRFIGMDGSLGLKKDNVYKLHAKIEGGFIRLNIFGKSVPYTIMGFMENWETVK